MKEVFVYPVLVISVTVLCLLTSLSTAAMFPFLQDVELRMPHVRPTQNETYLCTAYHVKPNQHEYIVAFKPNASMHVAHHILIYGCMVPGYREMDSPRAVWDCGEMTHSHSEYQTGGTCAEGPQIIYAWARDAPPLSLPRGVGFKIGGNSGIRYLVLQVHYADTTAFLSDNKNDSSGVILSVLPGNTPFVTRRAAIYLLGTGGMIRAHKMEHFETACRINEDITLHPFAFRTHTHQLGKAVTGYIVRNGRWINVGKHDPLQPQMFYEAKKNITVQKGDVLAARCTMYNFRDRDTYVGATGNDEMCNFYMMYYVEGDRILEQNECFSYGPPIYYWGRDRLLSNALTPEMDKDASTLD